MNSPLGEQRGQDSWLALAARLADGERRARDEFRREYAPGIRLLFQRQMGSIGLDRLITETLEGVIAGIETARIRSPRDMTRFVRSALARHKGADRGSPPVRCLSAPQIAPADRTRLRLEIERLSGALGRLSERERQMLICFFVRGFSERDIEVEFNVSREQFLSLRECLVDALRLRRIRKTPSVESSPGIGRAATGQA